MAEENALDAPSVDAPAVETPSERATPTEAQPVEVMSDAEAAEIEAGELTLEDLEGPSETKADTNADEGTSDPDPNAEGDAEEGDETGEGEGEPETVEFTFGGNKLEVPKGAIPDELAEKIQTFSNDTYADYMRKSQANADVAKTLATRSEAVEKLTQLNGQALQTYSLGLQLRSDIEQLQSVDLPALWQSDPDQARRVSDVLASKQADFQNIVSRVQEFETGMDEQQQQFVVQQRTEGRARLENYAKDFTSKIAPEIVAYVVNDYGMDETEAGNWDLNPIVAQMAHKAMLYDRMQAEAAKPQKPKPAAPNVVPIKAKGTARTGTTDPDKMSMDQLAKEIGIRH